MNQKKYLRRIGVNKTEILPNLQNLKLLQRKHLLSVPFENLDIHWKRLIVLDTEKIYRKIIEENRGGFCYELNGLFYELLKSIGFQSKLISARVAKSDGKFSAEKDHMAILTQIGDEEYLVDVGFGSFIAEPLKFVLNVEQNDTTGIYLINKYDDKYFQVMKKDGGNWASEFIFTTVNYNLKDFTDMCNFHQTSPESHFTKGELCSLMTNDGRKTLTKDRFITTKSGQKNEKSVNSKEEFNEILEREFYITPLSQ